MKENPFLMDGCVTPAASVNKLRIMGLNGIELEEDIKGKTAYEIFSTKLFIEEIRKHSKQLDMKIETSDEGMLPQSFEKCLSSQNKSIRNTAEQIMKKFGRRLGVILLALKKGDAVNKAAREDWKTEHWEFWGQVNKVALLGGLASGTLGRVLKDYAEVFYRESNEKGFQLLLADKAYNYGILGCATLVAEENSHALLFDFGHSYIKRSLAQYNGQLLEKIYNLEKLPAKWVDFNYGDENLEREDSFSLNNYIVNIIVDTCVEAEESGFRVGHEIIISIANYVNHGRICSRGGYGKLRFLADNYEEYLSSQLSRVLRKKISVKLIHDASAAALVFSGSRNTACITLGTAFGVGFPEECKRNRIISDKVEMKDIRV